MFAGTPYLRTCEYVVLGESRHDAAQGTNLQSVAKTNLLGTIRFNFYIEPAVRFCRFDIKGFKYSLQGRFSPSEQP